MKTTKIALIALAIILLIIPLACGETFSCICQTYNLGIPGDVWTEEVSEEKCNSLSETSNNGLSETKCTWEEDIPYFYN